MALDPDSLPELDTALRKLARRLVVDAAKADDVVQDAWLVALRRDDGTVASWAAWLSGTVRRLTGEARRTQERRARRESAFAPSERVPSTAEFVEREAMRRQLMDALFGLPEMYRIALALRFLDDLTPREVAAKLSVPLETARTRIKRGVELLRERLDAEFGGDRRAWGLALAPLAVPQAHALGAALTTAAEVLLMNVATKTGLVAAALCGITWVVLALNDAPGRADEPTKPPHSARASEIDESTPRDLAVASDVATTRSVAEIEAPAATPTTAASTCGTLELTLHFAGDRAPGAGVGIEIMCFGGHDPYHTTRKSIADAAGAARFDDVPAGGVTVRLDRGTVGSGTIVAGETTRLALDIGPGALVEGIVLTPERVPVADASIFLSLNGPEPEGFIVARTLRDGTFSLRDVTSMHLLGARAPGYGPSALPFVMGNPGAKQHFELVLRARGSSIVGRVLDSDGKPLANALVEANESRLQEDRAEVTFDDGNNGYRDVGLRARTDDRGAFAFDGVAAGSPYTIRARATGYAVTSTTVTPGEGARVTTEIRMPPTPTLHGRIVDADGKPMAAALVRIGDWTALDSGAADSDAHGEFTVETLPVGPVDVVARVATGQTARQRVELVAGATTETTIALPVSLQIFGRVVDKGGLPCPNFTVHAQPVRLVDRDDVRDVIARDDGSFTIDGCRDVPYNLSVVPPDVFDPGPIVRTGVRPGGEPVVLVADSAMLPTGKITMCVVDPSGQPVGGAMVMSFLMGSDIGVSHATAPVTGCVAIESLVPGRYSLMIDASGFARVQLPLCKVGENQVIDLGTIRVAPAGSLTAVVTGSADAAKDAIHAVLVGADSTQRCELDSGETPGSFVGKGIPPGPWTLIVQTHGVFITPMPIEIASGRETHVELPAVAGVAVDLVISGLAGLSLVAQPYCRVFAADGRLMIDRMKWRDNTGDTQRYAVTLPPGDYVARAGAIDATGETKFSVGDKPTSVEIAVR